MPQTKHEKMLIVNNGKRLTFYTLFPNDHSTTIQHLYSTEAMN